MAVLTALAAYGKDFDRATLNAMLDKLSASPEPKINRGPMAMCYKMAMPKPAECRYVCPKCGKVTRYISAHLKNDLAFLRDGATELKGRGLDIALEESALCRICTPGPKMPRTARIKTSCGPFAAGETVTILEMADDSPAVAACVKDLWVASRYVDRKKSCITADSVRVRSRPHTDAPIVTQLNCGHRAELLPMDKDDPQDWARLAPGTYATDDRGAVPVPMERLADVSYGEGDFALENRRFQIAWRINGHCTPARKTDVALLRAFLPDKEV